VRRQHQGAELLAAWSGWPSTESRGNQQWSKGSPCTMPRLCRYCMPVATSTNDLYTLACGRTNATVHARAICRMRGNSTFHSQLDNASLTLDHIATYRESRGCVLLQRCNMPNQSHLQFCCHTSTPCLGRHSLCGEIACSGWPAPGCPGPHIPAASTSPEYPEFAIQQHDSETSGNHDWQSRERLGGCPVVRLRCCFH
jgi:hypothetical protein